MTPITKVLIAILAVNLLLLAATAALAVVAYRTAEAANSVRHQTYLVCMSGNDARRAERELWGYLFNLPPAQPETAQEQAEVAQFKRYVAVTFAPRKC